MGRPVHSTHSLPSVAASLLSLALLAAVPSSAQTAIVADPALPGAHVPFRLLVSGTIFFLLEPMDPEPDVQIEGDEIVLRFGGRSQGIGTPAAMPYAFWVDFPDGLPASDGYGGLYTVHVDIFLHDEPGQVFRQASLPLVVEAGVAVSLPARVTETETATIVLEGTASCPELGDTVVSAGEIHVDLDLDCLLLPPEPAPFRFDIELEPLAAGSYRVVVGSGDTVHGVASFEVLPDPPRLQGDRFLVDVTFASHSDSGRASLVQAPSRESALFWFFGEDNWELMLKVLDGCAINGHFWVFGAATTDVAHDITIEDTATGNLWTHSNPQGRVAEAITDTRAFPCISDDLEPGP